MQANKENQSPYLPDKRTVCDLKGTLLLTSDLRIWVLKMLDTGVILPPESDFMKAKADAALHSLASGHPDQTAERLAELVDLTYAVVQAGRLPEEQGLPLIEAAKKVILRLGG